MFNLESGVHVFPRHIFEQNLSNFASNIPIISISDVGDKVNIPKDIDLNIIQLEFADNSSAFTIEQAKTIVDFIKKNKNSNVFVIHCFAGLSRSAGVGVWVNNFIGFNELSFYQRHPKIQPNKHVVDLLNKVAGTDYKIKDVFMLSMPEWYFK